MKKLSNEKLLLNATRLTDAQAQKLIEDMGEFISLLEAASFKLETFRHRLERVDKQEMGTLKVNIDKVLTKHRTAEKRANPAGYEKYSDAFDNSASTLIDLVSALRKGEIRVEHVTEIKAA